MTDVHELRKRGWWNMACWNALSEDQQLRLVVQGNLPFGYVPEGDGCDEPATVCVETMWDEAPGPRFYCEDCAVFYLQGVRDAPARRRRVPGQQE